VLSSTLNDKHVVFYSRFINKNVDETTDSGIHRAVPGEMIQSTGF